MSTSKKQNSFKVIRRYSQSTSNHSFIHQLLYFTYECQLLKWMSLLPLIQLFSMPRTHYMPHCQVNMSKQVPCPCYPVRTSATRSLHLRHIYLIKVAGIKFFILTTLVALARDMLNVFLLSCNISCRIQHSQVLTDEHKIIRAIMS